jgi:hypothetical protein
LACVRQHFPQRHIHKQLSSCPPLVARRVYWLAVEEADRLILSFARWKCRTNKLNLKFQYNAHTACWESRSRSRPIVIAVVVTSKPVSSLATGTGGTHDPGGIRYSWHWVRFVEQPVLQQCVKNSSLGIKRRGPEIYCKKPMQSMTQAIVMPFEALHGRRAQPIPPHRFPTKIHPNHLQHLFLQCFFVQEVHDTPSLQDRMVQPRFVLFSQLKWIKLQRYIFIFGISRIAYSIR